jgi:hypothetical protein
MLKVTAFLTALFFTGFSFLASLVIFAESVQITQDIGYTNTTKYGILFAIMKNGFKKANEIKRSL